MKKILIIVFAFIIFSDLSKAQTLHWAYNLANPSTMESFTDISSNANNRFAVIGSGNQGVSLDFISGNSNYNSSGLFLAVYNENAAIQWKVDLPGTVSTGIKMNANGEVFVIGRNSLDYLAKYGASGNLIWSTSFTTSLTPSKIVELPNGKIIVAGDGGASTVTLSDNTVVNLNKGAYLLEFSSSGDLIGAYNISVPAPAQFINIYELTTDASSNIYIGGQLDGIADFDMGSGVSQNTMTNGYDAFVAKYNSSFQLQWFKTFGDNNNAPKGWDKTHAIEVDGSGNIYVGGEFTWTTDFDPSNPGTYVLTSDDNTQGPSGFLLQYSSSGTLNWVKKIGNLNQTGNIYVDRADVWLEDIKLYGNSIIVMVGGIGKVDMDPSTDTAYVLMGELSSPSLFFGKYDLTGAYQAAFAVGTTVSMAETRSVGLELLANETFVTAGTFQKTVDFDPTSAVYNLQVTGSSFDKDLYVAKYSFATPMGLSENIYSGAKVYPNPFHNRFWINMPATTCKVYDLQGRLLKEDMVNGSEIDLSEVNPGAYIIEIFNGTMRVYSGLTIKE